MRIAGFQPITLSDYPGNVAAIVFTQGCSFCCPFCHNHSLLLDDKQVLRDPEIILVQLNQRKTLLDGVVISGGEPTIHRDLPLFLTQIKDLDLLVKLDTNGAHPDMLRRLLTNRLVDFIAMDIKAPFAKYEQLAGVPVSVSDLKKSIRQIENSGITHHFRTTWVPDLLSEEDIMTIRQSLPSGSPYKIQTFIPELAMDPGLLKAG